MKSKELKTNIYSHADSLILSYITTVIIFIQALFANLSVKLPSLCCAAHSCTIHKHQFRTICCLAGSGTGMLLQDNEPNVYGTCEQLEMRTPSAAQNTSTAPFCGPCSHSASSCAGSRNGIDFGSGSGSGSSHVIDFVSLPNH